MNSYRLIIVLLLLGGAWLPVAYGASPPPMTGQSLDSRLQSVRKLIETSSAANQVKGSHSEQAKAQHARARALYSQAVKAYEAGDRQAAEQALTAATKTMFEAVRLAEQPQVVGAKKQQDFNNRLESINALMAAHERISVEKGRRDANKELRRVVDPKVAEAQRLAKDGNLDEGRTRLDQAYTAAKVAIEELRGGDTLVRSLNFSNKEEEYHYEIDRNDTHRMLIDVLLKEKMQQSHVKNQVDPFLKKAADLRAQAEKHAASGRYEAAIEALEASTQELVRAIRSAGVYIPG